MRDLWHVLWLILPVLYVLLGGCSRPFSPTSSKQPTWRQTIEKVIAEEKKELLDVPFSDTFRERAKKRNPFQDKNPWPQAFHVRCSCDLLCETKPAEVLNLLVRHFGLNVIMDPVLEKTPGLTYYAHRKPLFQIIEDLCRLCQWRFSLHKEECHIMPDQPYLQTYNVQFLLGSRKTNNQVAVGTELFSGIKETSASSEGNTTTIKTEMHSDFWTELEENLKLILQAPAPELPSGKYSLHKYGGLLTVWGTENQHHLVKNYIERLQKLISTQVLIEAKIVEVELSKEYSQGIDWSGFNNLKSLPSEAGLEKWKTVGLNISTLQNAVSFFEKFGKVKTLSNPRLLVLNNQTAILKVVVNKVFYNLKNETRYVGRDSSPIKEMFSQFETIPVGLLLVVQPSVVQSSEQGQDVFLSFRPTLSTVLHYTPDPAVALNLGPKNLNNLTAINNQYAGTPEIQSKGIDSFVLLKNGETIAVGGLLDESQSQENKGIPHMSRLPILGSAFGKSSKNQKLSELVIFIKVTVLNA